MKNIIFLLLVSTSLYAGDLCSYSKSFQNKQATDEYCQSGADTVDYIDENSAWSMERFSYTGSETNPTKILEAYISYRSLAHLLGGKTVDWVFSSLSKTGENDLYKFLNSLNPIDDKSWQNLVTTYGLDEAGLSYFFIQFQITSVGWREVIDLMVVYSPSRKQFFVFKKPTVYLVTRGLAAIANS